MRYEWWLVPVVIIGVRLVFAEASLRYAKSKGGSLVFAGPASAKVLFAAVSLAIGFLLIKQGRASEWWADLILAFLPVCFAFAWPKTVVTDTSGVSSLVWWRKKRFVAWANLLDVEREGDGAITLYATDGTVRFEAYNIDRRRFEREVLRRSDIKKIRSRSRLTTLSG